MIRQAKRFRNRILRLSGSGRWRLPPWIWRALYHFIIRRQDSNCRERRPAVKYDVSVCSDVTADPDFITLPCVDWECHLALIGPSSLVIGSDQSEVAKSVLEIRVDVQDRIEVTAESVDRHKARTWRIKVPPHRRAGDIQILLQRRLRRGIDVITRDGEWNSRNEPRRQWLKKATEESEVPVNDNSVGMAFCRGGLYAFDPETDAQAWSFPWRARKHESGNVSTPVVSRNRVLITESYGPGGMLLDVSGDKPKVIWQDGNVRNQRLSCHWCTPILIDGFACGCHGESAGSAELRCVELETGEIKWGQPDLGRCTLMYARDARKAICFDMQHPTAK